MLIEQLLSEHTLKAIKSLYQSDFDASKIVFQKTNPEFEGDITLVVFPFVKISKKSPEVTANELGSYLKENLTAVEKFNVVKGFLNLVVSKDFWLNFFNESYPDKNFGIKVPAPDSPLVMVEYSSPNTNKPLHL
ncbi:MAG TPA: arginine--tRNA ligase, partial [Bacteroidia bacterium]